MPFPDVEGKKSICFTPPFFFCYWPFKSWLLMNKIFCCFAYGNKLIVSSKARTQLFDPEQKSMPPPPFSNGSSLNLIFFNDA
jgi:hypothetical protein